MSFHQGEDKMNDGWKIGAWFSAQKQKVRSDNTKYRRTHSLKIDFFLFF